MKFLLFLAGVVFLQMISVGQSSKEIFDACVKELGITDEMFGDTPENNQKKPKFHCFHACIMKKSGQLEEGNKINYDKMKEIASKFFGDKVDTIIKARQECEQESRAITDECDFVNAVKSCTYKKIPDLKNMFKTGKV